ncbi:LppB [Rodentibacter pneumotropicus]|uniref:LppB n=1 Tax=Rodentibacter pneumotropicus TaxID=758 RepID=A0A448MJG9_9PAST|nr:LppB [Rodentibacter pneumotropicus]
MGRTCYFVAGFSPIPYKVFTLCAGVMQMAFFPFVLTAFISRAARFLLVAKLAAWGGENLQQNCVSLLKLLVGQSLHLR